MRNKILILFILFILYGCSVPLSYFSEFKKYCDPETKISIIRLPVILVPGMKGSLLKKGDKEIWGKGYRVTLLHKFDELQLPLDLQTKNYYPDDFKSFYEKKGIVNGGIMESYKVSFFGLRLNVPIYENLKNVLLNIGGYKVDEDLCIFSYDWRLDNRIAAVKLAFEILNIQNNFKDKLKNKLGSIEFKNIWNEYKRNNLLDTKGNIKINILAHSMGGLVARYYIQMLGGYKSINKLIMLGTPNSGAMDSLKAIYEGEYPESLLPPLYSKSKTRPTIFSWPSIYQLLPRYSDCLIDKKNSPVNKQDSWGLGISDIDEKIFSVIIKNWTDFNLIPNDFEENDKRCIESFLKEKLIDSIKFYNAINGNPDANYEQHVLKNIAIFINVNIESLEIGKEFLLTQSPVKYFIFGGNCKKTVRDAKLIDGKTNNKHIEFVNQKNLSSESISVSVGDGCVPVDSLRIKNRQLCCDLKFFICEDHVGLVKNTTFQYNLLKELLEQSKIR